MFSKYNYFRFNNIMSLSISEENTEVFAIGNKTIYNYNGKYFVNVGKMDNSRFITNNRIFKYKDDTVTIEKFDGKKFVIEKQIKIGSGCQYKGSYNGSIKLSKNNKTIKIDEKNISKLPTNSYIKEIDNYIYTLGENNKVSVYYKNKLIKIYNIKREDYINDIFHFGDALVIVGSSYIYEFDGDLCKIKKKELTVDNVVIFKQNYAYVYDNHIICGDFKYKHDNVSKLFVTNDRLFSINSNGLLKCYYNNQIYEYDTYLKGYSPKIDIYGNNTLVISNFVSGIVTLDFN